MGYIWVGTSKGLFRINSKTKAYEIFLPDITKPDAISDGAITYI